MENNVFNELSDAITRSLTHFINNFSGLLQIFVYLMIGFMFLYALVKSWQTVQALVSLDASRMKLDLRNPEQLDDGAPLAAVAASFFCQTKRHYLVEKHNDPHAAIPPDGFIRDAAFQYSERFLEERFLEPISQVANLMPALGFIGTIIGLVVHFLSNTGALNGNLTVAGIATALYTTFIGLLCYTVLELLLKVFSSLGRKRIDQGLAAVKGQVVLNVERKAA